MDLFSLALLVGVSLALTIGLKVRWLVSLRLEDFERRIADVEAKRPDTGGMRRLEDRVHALETAMRVPQPTPVALAPPALIVTPDPEPSPPSLSESIREHVYFSEVGPDIAPPVSPEAPPPLIATADPEPAPPAWSDPIPD